MPRKETLYFKKNKASKELEYDNFYSESEKFLRQREESHDRYKHKPQKTKHKYKRTHDYPHYEDQYYGNRTTLYDKDPYYYNSEYKPAVTNKDFYYISNDSESDNSQLIPDRKHHNQIKERKKRLSENPVYNYKSQNEQTYNNSRKQRISPVVSIGNENKNNEKDFNVYISQQPIALWYKDDHNESLDSTAQKKPKSKTDKRYKIPSFDLEQHGDHQICTTEVKNISFNKVSGQKHQGDFSQINSFLTEPPNITSQPIYKEQIINSFQNNDQSYLGLAYLPVFVTNHNGTPQMAASLQPAIFFYNNDGMEGELSKELMTVFTAFNTSQNNIFKQENNINKTINRENEISKHSQHVKSNKSFSDFEQVAASIKPMLQDSGKSAMTASSYALLLASYPQQSPPSATRVTSLIGTKLLKKVKGVTPHQHTSNQLSAENKQHKHKSSIIPGNEYEEVSVVNPKEDDKKIQDIRRAVSEQKEDSQNIVINIRENSFTNNVLPITTQTKGKGMSKKDRVTERQSLVNRKKEFSERNGAETSNVKNGQQTIGDKEVFSPNNQSKTGETFYLAPKNYTQNMGVERRSSMVPKNYTIVSDDMGIEQNYKKVGSNQQSRPLKSFNILDGNGNFAVDTKGGFNGISVYQLYNQSYEEESNPVINFNPKESSFTEKEKMQSLRKSGEETKSEKINEKLIFPSHDDGFTRDTSLNELKQNSPTSIKNKEEVGVINNSKGTSKIESISQLKGSNILGEREMIGCDKNNQEENIETNQQENNNLTNSALNTAEVKKSDMRKPQEISYINMDGELTVSPSSLSELYDNVEFDRTLQMQPDGDNELIHKKGSKSSITQFRGKPSLKTIYPVTERYSTVQCIKETLDLQSEYKEELSNDRCLKVWEYTKFLIIVFLQTGHFILGVSFYDKLINVINFYCYDDNY